MRVGTRICAVIRHMVRTTGGEIVADSEWFFGLTAPHLFIRTKIAPPLIDAYA